MKPVMQAVEKLYLKEEVPKFDVGDKVEVHMRIVEGEKERIQVIEGIVIRKRGDGTRATFTVRKDSHGTGVERLFPLHSPRVEKVKVVRRNVVRRARLYYLRELTGKAARLTEKFDKTAGKKKEAAPVSKPKAEAKTKAEPKAKKKDEAKPK
jgi:large subunit ribosomal protein L19